MFQILFKAATGALVLISKNNHELYDYLAEGFSPISEGRKISCLAFLDDYFEENFIPDEERIYTTVN